jgi:hypothetical protein
VGRSPKAVAMLMRFEHATVRPSPKPLSRD